MQRKRKPKAKRSSAPAPLPVRVKRDIPAHLEAAERALEDVLRTLQDNRCACGDLDEIRIALREALNNAVRHGSRLNPRKRVHLDCRCDPAGGLEIVISDEGEGFDPDRIPDPTRPENLERFSGRGIYLIKQLMDAVEFRNRGREIRLRRLPAQAGRPRRPAS